VLPKQKNPNFPGGESRGFGNHAGTQPSPRKDPKGNTIPAGFLARGYLLPTPSRTCVQWLKIAISFQLKI
jgi:hypothetical protein